MYKQLEAFVEQIDLAMGHEVFTFRVPFAEDNKIFDHMFHNPDKGLYYLGATKHSGITKMVYPPVLEGDKVYLVEPWKLGLWKGEDQAAVDYVNSIAMCWVTVDDPSIIKESIKEAGDQLSWEMGSAPTKWREPINMPLWASRIRGTVKAVIPRCAGGFWNWWVTVQIDFCIEGTLSRFEHKLEDSGYERSSN